MGRGVMWRALSSLSSTQCTRRHLLELHTHAKILTAEFPSALTPCNGMFSHTRLSVSVLMYLECPRETCHILMSMTFNEKPVRFKEIKGSCFVQGNSQFFIRWSFRSIGQIRQNQTTQQNGRSQVKTPTTLQPVTVLDTLGDQ